MDQDAPPSAARGAPVPYQRGPHPSGHVGLPLRSARRPRRRGPPGGAAARRRRRNPNHEVPADPSRDDRAGGQLTELGTAIDCRDGYAALPPSSGTRTARRAPPRHAMISHGQRHRMKTGKRVLTRHRCPRDRLSVGMMPEVWLIRSQAVHRPSNVRKRRELPRTVETCPPW